MSYKLSDKQTAALEALNFHIAKSGGYYRGLGIYPATLNSLERLGFAESTGDWKPSRQQWRITDAGRRVLAPPPSTTER